MLRAFAVVLVAISAAAASAREWHYVSLKGKTDAELLALLSSGRDAIQVERAAIIPTRLPDRFWELPPKEAALELLRANRSPKNRAAAKLTFTESGVPPESGEVGFEWRFVGDVFRPAAGVTVLRSGSGEADAPRSRQPLAERERRSARTRAGDGAPFWGTADAAGEGRQEPESGARCGESVEPDSLSGYRFPGESAAPDAAARPTAERSTGSGIRNLRPTDAP